MARRPSRDEPFALPKGPAVLGARVYLKELAGFLRVSVSVVRKWVDDRGILYWESRGSGRHALAYVSEHAAMRAIAHFRAKQAEPNPKGHVFLQKLRVMDKQKALKGARAPINGGLTPQAPLANPRADTEDEP